MRLFDSLFGWIAALWASKKMSDAARRPHSHAAESDTSWGENHGHADDPDEEDRWEEEEDMDRGYLDDACHDDFDMY